MLLGLGLLIAVVAAAVLAVGQWAEGRVQTAVASRIEQQLPGSTATVRISSFPFLGRLAATGTVAHLQAEFDHVAAAPSPVILDRVDVDVRDLHLRRGDLLHRRVAVDRIGGATVTATVTQPSLDDALHLPVTLGPGTIGVGGVAVPVRIAVAGRQVTLSGPVGIHVSFALPSVDVLPCRPTVAVVTGAVHLGCTLHQLPAVIADGAMSF